MEKKLKILCAEDEADIRRIVALSLEMVGGHEVILCENGREAVTLAAEKLPDLIILDVMMPELDGTEALKHIQECPKTAKIPVVFLTARIQGAEVEAYRELGAVNVIGKPFHPVELPAIVEEIWRNHCARSGTHAV